MGKNKEPVTVEERIIWLQEMRSIGQFRVEETRDDDLSTMLNQILIQLKKEQAEYTTKPTEEEIKDEAYSRYPMKRDGQSEAAIRSGKLRAFIQCGDWFLDRLSGKAMLKKSKEEPKTPLIDNGTTTCQGCGYSYQVCVCRSRRG